MSGLCINRYIATQQCTGVAIVTVSEPVNIAAGRLFHLSRCDIAGDELGLPEAGLFQWLITRPQTQYLHTAVCSCHWFTVTSAAVLVGKVRSVAVIGIITLLTL